MKGYPEGDFRPNQNMTRAEVAALFSRLPGGPSTVVTQGNYADDIEIGAWYVQSVRSLYDTGLMKGYPDGSFQPEQPITRAEVVSIANRMQDRPTDKAFVSEHLRDMQTFSDLTDEHYWAYHAILAATNSYEAEVISPYHWLRIIPQK